MLLLAVIKSINGWLNDLLLCYHAKTPKAPECPLHVFFALLPLIEASLVEVVINYSVVDERRKVDTVQAFPVTTGCLKVSACSFENKAYLSII